MLQLEASKEKLKTISNGIKPMLDLIDQEVPELNRAPRPDIIVERCKSALENFKHYAHGIACSAVGHAMAVVRSVYPLVKLKWIDGGFARNLSDEQITALEEEVSDSAIKLADDMDLFGDAGNEPWQFRM